MVVLGACCGEVTDGGDGFDEVIDGGACCGEVTDGGEKY